MSTPRAGHAPELPRESGTYGSEVRGFIHLHLTTENLPLKALVREHRKRGHDFLAITDHPADIDGEEFHQRKRMCSLLCRRGFACIYGLEGRTASGPHLMGLGVRRYIMMYALELEDAVSAVRAAGGLAVLAHATERDVALAQSRGIVPDGVEVWNALRGGWGANPRVVSAVRRGRGWQNVPLFGGPDAHRAGQLFKVATIVRATGSDPSHILAALERGDFVIKRGPMHLDPRTTSVPALHSAVFYASSIGLTFLRKAGRKLKRFGIARPRMMAGLERWI